MAILTRINSMVLALGGALDRHGHPFGARRTSDAALNVQAPTDAWFNAIIFLLLMG
jgi:hypothetical protein